MYMKSKGIFPPLLIDIYDKLYAIYRYIVSTLVLQHHAALIASLNKSVVGG